MADIKEFRKINKITQSELAEYLCIGQPFISQIEKGIRPMPSEYISKLLANKEWDTSMFTNDDVLKTDNIQDSHDESKIPFYDLDVTASISESFHDSPEIPQYYINFPPLNDCNAAFPVYGESMEPDFYAGEIVLVKEITNVDSMLWGEPYLVITNANCDNLRTIKNVYLSEDRQKFILRATNPRYAGDTIVSRDDVIKIFLVKGKLNRRQL